MKIEDVADLLDKRFGEKIPSKNLEAMDPWIEVRADAVLEVGAYCRDEPDLRLDYLKNMTAVDWLITDARLAKKISVEPHLEVVYHLFSFMHKHDVTLKVMLNRWKDDKEGELPELHTVSGIWKIADWHEREIYDLFGIRFINHPNLRRILCPEDWEGYPLRKDYVFPTEYHGIRCQ